MYGPICKEITRENSHNRRGRDGQFASFEVHGVNPSVQRKLPCIGHAEG